MSLTLQLIEQAIVLGEAGNFARAAERLGISQPTLSRNIAALETKLGFRLFDRGRGGAAPTVFGSTLIERGTLLVNDASALRAELQALAGLETGYLAVAAGPYAADDLVGPTVARLIRDRAGLRVRVGVFGPEEISPAVLSGQFDVGLGSLESQLPHDELRITALRERRLYLAARAGHPLAGTQPTQAQVLAFPLVTVLLQGKAAQAAATGSSAGFEDLPRKGFAPAVEVNSLDTAKRIAEHSDALFPASAPMVAAEIADQRLITIDYDSPVLRTQPAIVRLRRRTPSPAALRFLQLIHELDAELAGASLPGPRTR